MLKIDNEKLTTVKKTLRAGIEERRMQTFTPTEAVESLKDEILDMASVGYSVKEIEERLKELGISPTPVRRVRRILQEAAPSSADEVTPAADVPPDPALLPTSEPMPAMAEPVSEAAPVSRPPILEIIEMPTPPKFDAEAETAPAPVPEPPATDPEASSPSFAQAGHAEEAVPDYSMESAPEMVPPLPSPSVHETTKEVRREGTKRVLESGG